MSDSKKVISGLLWAAVLLSVAACDTEHNKSSNKEFLSETELKKVEKIDPVYHLTDEEMRVIEEKKREYQEGTGTVISRAKESGSREDKIRSK